MLGLIVFEIFAFKWPKFWILGIPSPKGETTVSEISVTAQKYKADLISDKTHTSVAFVDNNSADI